MLPVYYLLLPIASITVAISVINSILTTCTIGL